MSQSKAEAWAKWRGLVAEQAQSGRSIARFCFARGLNSDQFYTWKKKLGETEAPRFVSLELAPVVETKWPAADRALSYSSVREALARWALLPQVSRAE